MYIKDRLPPGYVTWTAIGTEQDRKAYAHDVTSGLVEVIEAYAAWLTEHSANLNASESPVGWSSELRRQTTVMLERADTLANNIHGAVAPIKAIP